MEKLTLNDVAPLSVYRTIREDFRRKIIEAKQTRRIDVGDRFTFIFENRETMLLQVQEMIWIERITDEKEIRHLLDTYNTQIPDRGELSATLFINLEATGFDALDQSKVRAQLDQVLGVERAIAMRINGELVKAEPEVGYSKEDDISAVQYLKFRFTDEQVDAFKDESRDASLVIDHRNFKLSAKINGPLRKSLISDLST